MIGDKRCERRLEIYDQSYKRYVLQYYVYHIIFLILNYIIENSTHLKLCLANAIHSFKWVEVI